MRLRLYGWLVVAWALAAACVSAPEPADWLALGFRTPEQTFQSFQTGLRAELPDLEYRSLSSGFKRREGLTQLAYREYRHELFRREPWLKLAAEAKIERVERISDARARLVARVDTWFHEERFELELVREDYYEVWVDGARRDDGNAAWLELVREEDAALVVTVPRPPALQADELSEVVAGREWKIDSLPRRMELNP